MTPLGRSVLATVTSLLATMMVMMMTMTMTTATSAATTTVQAREAHGIINMTAAATSSLPFTMATTPRVGGRSVTEAAVELVRYSCIFDQDYLLLRRLAYMETSDGTTARTYSQPGYYGGIWRVDEPMFRKTQANSPQLRVKYAAIRQQFGIDWMAVRWTDLQKPLYSALAAALYLSLQGNVPVSEAEQGVFVHNHYDSSITAFNYSRLVHQIPVCDQDPRIDVAFLLDATTSLDSFVRMRDFVADVLDAPLNLTSGNIRVSVYQYGGDRIDGTTVVLKNIDYILDDNKPRVLSSIRGLGRASLRSSVPDEASVVRTVLADAFSGSSTRPLSTKVLVILTDKSPGNSSSLRAAGREAEAKGVSVMAVGTAQSAQLEQLVTDPHCRHYVTVPDFGQLRYTVPLLQRALCDEPMIVQGTVQCTIEDCRNVAFPITARTTTIIANTTCDNGRVAVTTRMPRPGRGFDDFSSLVDNYDVHGPAYVTVDDVRGKFIYADLFGIGASDPSCVATISSVNGIVGQRKEQQCSELQYPVVNPCQKPNRTVSRFPYDGDRGFFIQCDLQDHMYLTRCPPGEPYYSPECEACVGGSASPYLTGCQGSLPHVSTPYCGLSANPCTRDNILQGHFFFACPQNETMYLQCNSWGHAYVKQCPQNEVWRQKALTCEFHNTLYNPCGPPGVRYYPYPPDHRYFIDCGADMVPNLKACQEGLVWDPRFDTCDYPLTASPLPVTLAHLTARVTLPSRPVGTLPPNGGSSATPNPVSGLISQNFAAPCTHEHVAAQKLFWPYASDPHRYIQCDLWGDAFVRTCQPGQSYDRFSFTCVNGDVIVDNHLTDGVVG